MTPFSPAAPRSRTVVMFFLVLAAAAWPKALAEHLPPRPTKPNIVFVLVDDWGFADVGFRNSKIKTPNFDGLAAEGVILGRHYVFKYCSPSRASFLTGRWPHHAHQWNPYPNMMAGTNLNMTMLPAKLKTAGYATHIVGKWHQGFYLMDYTPVARGFDSSTGFLNGAEDHFNQTVGCATDYWRNDAPDKRNGTYDAYTYRQDLQELIRAHDVSTPLFLYLPLHNVHGPDEAPQEWLDIYEKNSTCERRRVYQAMVSVADNVTGVVVEALKQRNMWKNTIFVVSADNGGCGGSNYPLKGGKMNFFEGGVRALAFAAGGSLPDTVTGTHNDGFIHIADWYTTFCKMAGVDPDDSGPGRFPVDGVDIWPILSGANKTTPHHEIVLGFNFTYNQSYPSQGAIIIGQHKLIIGEQGVGCGGTRYQPLDSFCTRTKPTANCQPYCLYDIINDPEERQDLSGSEKDLLNEMLSRYNRYASEPRAMHDQGYHSQSNVPIDENVCTTLADHGGYWIPWKSKK